MFHLSAGLVPSYDKYLRIWPPRVSAIFIFKSKLMSSPARGLAKLYTIYSMNWFLRSPAPASPLPSHHVNYFFSLRSSDQILTDCKYFQSNIFDQFVL